MCIVHEDIEAGSVQKIDFGVAPLQGSDCCIDGDLSVCFLLIKISKGIPFIHFCEAAGNAGRVKHGSCQLGFPGMTMTSKGHVAYIFTVVDSHRFIPRSLNGM